MTNAVITWIGKEFGLIHTEIVAIEPEVLAWAKNFLATITPILRQAATDAVLAAVSVPGSGAIKAAAALAAATLDLTTKGVPVIEADLKAAIQIAYNALPAAVTGNTAATAVVGAANSELDKLAAKLVPADAAATATAAVAAAS
jgi:hypothetical protein